MVKTRRTLLLSGLVGALAIAAPLTVRAAAWPKRSVKFIVPFGPGAGADIGAPVFADKLQAQWSEPVVVENRPGGDSIVAITTFLNANDWFSTNPFSLPVWKASTRYWKVAADCPFKKPMTGIGCRCACAARGQG